MVKKVWLVDYNFDSQALSASLADMDGFEFAALDTLQHGLAGHAEQLGGLLHHDIAVGGVFDKLTAEVIGHANLPGSAGRGLFPGDEAVVDPAMQG